MRVILIAASLLLTSLAFAPTAQADAPCIVDANGGAGAVCNYMNVAVCAAYVGNDHVVCMNPGSRLCLVNTDGVCIYT